MKKSLLLDLPKFELPTPDVLLFHPDDFAIMPWWWKAKAEEAGVEVRAQPFMIKGKIVGMGKGADLLRSVEIRRFHREVASAMKENAAFLDLLKRNGLLEQHP